MSCFLNRQITFQPKVGIKLPQRTSFLIDKVQYAEDIMARLLKFFYFIDVKFFDIQAWYVRITKVLRFQNRQLFWNVMMLCDSMAILAKKGIGEFAANVDP